MKIEAYLVINDRGSLKVRTTRPALSNDEIAVVLNIDVPNAFFERLMPVVNINLPAEAVMKPGIDTSVEIVSAEVAAALKLEVTDVIDGLKELLKEKQLKNSHGSIEAQPGAGGGSSANGGGGGGGGGSRV